MFFNVVRDVVSGIVGPLFGWLQKKEDTKVVESNNDVEVIKARTTLIGVIHKDPAIATGFYLFIVPSGIHYALVIYDSCFRLLIPQYTWRILEIPGNMQYIPYAVVAFLFGLAWRGKL